MEKSIKICRRRVRQKMILSILLQVLGFGVMLVGGVGIYAEGVKQAEGLGLLFAGVLLIVGIVMFVVGLEIQPYKDFIWEDDKEGDLLHKREGYKP